MIVKEERLNGPYFCGDVKLASLMFKVIYEKRENDEEIIHTG